MSLGLAHGSELLAAVHARREAYLQRCAGGQSASSTGEGGGPLTVLRLLLRTEWRIAVGLGLEYGMLESGIALHGTYGFPMIPASALKGVVAAAAGSSGAAVTEQVRILGGPLVGSRPEGQSAEDAELATTPRRGSVVFLDALPGPSQSTGNGSTTGVTVHRDVVTPHQKPYYQSSLPSLRKDRESASPKPPAEHHQPEPAPFLSLSGNFHVDLLGPGPDLDRAREWLSLAGDEFGIGGRTTAGYGYFHIESRG
ncbi:type III-B CRISPR module RAMP protein Cmr6 [Lipingzhangella sp. LS1_29]|uniref:Type III-B CRISPR module RAMP protein Cmr6 n=1 Tax=Lipingzhangella rawalii TaxID=2055835 RepID=A0ABU2H327_9ACTN|nr:type III-B CRISPR module RAMP protein Cmr6 [Lipingzhangella rawalii]MDS1269712.1 type III-B CRISPR module RAMP protein Cmr6 [Lipingzhangella rawalii]